MSPADDLLADVFRCEKYMQLFPSGMPLRACLRRQLELTALDRLPVVKWPAAKPFCQKDCPLGRENLARAAAAGIPSTTCSKCGSALIGAAAASACATCAARALEAGKGVPRGGLPKDQVGQSSRIWSGEVPDVPIGGPPRATAKPHHQ